MVNRNYFLLKTILIVSLLLGVSGLSSANDKTNIIYLMADDLGYADLNEEFMPRSYQIMQEYGTQLPLYSMQNCAPTRTALMTGKLPSNLGITGIDSVPNFAGIAPAEIMLPELLRDAGYSTGIFGKWHLGLELNQSPLNNGFDEFVGFTHGWVNYYGPRKNRISYPDGTIGHDHHGIHDFQYNGIPLYTESYSTFAFRNAAIEFIERNAEQEKPYFAYVPFNAPHGPHAAPRRYVDLYKDRFGINDAQIAKLYEYEDSVLAVPSGGQHNIHLALEVRLTELLYYASVRAMDDAIADIFETVVESGELDNTLFMFASDNGAGVGSIRRHGNNGHFRGGKGAPYEGGHRVANLLVWNGKIDPNHHVGINIWIGDLFATFASIAGAVSPSSTIESNDITVPLLNGANSFIRKNRGQHIVSHVIKNALGDRVQAIWAMNNASTKYIRFAYFDAVTNDLIEVQEELYQLANDPGETQNLVTDSRYQKMLDRMRRKFAKYGGDTMLQNLHVATGSGWAGYPLPQEWGFPNQYFENSDVLKSDLF